MSIRSGFGRASQGGSSVRDDEDDNPGVLSRCSLNPDVALRLFSGQLDPDALGDLLAAADFGGDLGSAAVPGAGPDEDLTQLTVPEDEPSMHPVEGGEPLLARVSRDFAGLGGTSPGAAAASAAAATGCASPGALSVASSDLAAQLSGCLLRSPSTRLAPRVAEAWSSASTYLKSSWQYAHTGRAAAAAVLAECGAELVPSGGPAGIEAHATRLITQHKLDDTLYVYDLGNVTRMYRGWRAALPRVTPHYAVKCNPEPALLKLLLALGAGFDCASKAELAAVLSLGAPRSRIIFAHPCKRPSDIAYAAEQHIEYTTFDTVSELEKIAAGNPEFRCVLRIRADDPSARVKLGLKYGADPGDAPALLKAAKDLGLRVAGVSFHVGSGARDPTTFLSAIAAARAVFDCAELMGHHMELLDIGGGFSGHFDGGGRVDLGAGVAAAINAALDDAFPEEMGVRVIAEPGRYFAETSATLFTPVYGQRERRPPGAPAPDPEHPAHTDYWITDGLYGSFNCILYDGQNPEFRVVRSPLLPPVPPELDAESEATVWGPTCDSADCVYKDISLPHLRNGDWLMWPNAGAYTVAGACDFNGINMTRPQTYYVFSVRAVDVAGGGGGEDGEGDGAPPPSTGALASAADSSRASDTGEE